MTTKTAKSGDCLCNMAADAGFYNCQPLRDETKNSALLDRPLQDGDEVTIPDVRPRTESVSTDAVHKFVIKTAPPVSMRFVHGSKDKHYLEDAEVPAAGEGLNVSTFVTTLGGANEKAKFPDAFEFHEEGHVDPATFKVEVVDPAAGGAVNVVLEAMKPVYKSDNVSVDHYETFDGAADAALRKIAALSCAQVRSAVSHRSKYLRLVVDELDKSKAPEQTLLVSDTADGTGGAADAVEILDQQVRARYEIVRCAGPATNKCTVTKQVQVGTDRKRVRIAVHVFKSPNIAVQAQDVRRRVKKWFRRVYAQANIAPKLVGPEIEFIDPPANNMLVISQNSGNSSTGVNAGGSQSTLSFDLFAGASAQANFTQDGSVKVSLTASQTPQSIGQAIKKALPAGYQAEVFLNPTAFGAAQGSADVLITKAGSVVDIRNELMDDTGATVTVPRVDVDNVVISEGKGTANEELDLNSLFSCTPEMRRIIRAAPGSGDRIEFYVTGLLVKRTDPNPDRTSSTRGTSLRPASDLASDIQPQVPLKRSVLLASFVMEAGDGEPFVMPHEAGHVLLDSGHAGDLLSGDPVETSALMFALVSAENSFTPGKRHLSKLEQVTKRLTDTRMGSTGVEPMTVVHQVDNQAKPRDRHGMDLKISEAERIRDRGKDVLQDWSQP